MAGILQFIERDAMVSKLNREADELLTLGRYEESGQLRQAAQLVAHPPGPAVARMDPGHAATNAPHANGVVVPKDQCGGMVGMTAPPAHRFALGERVIHRSQVGMPGLPVPGPVVWTVYMKCRLFVRGERDVQPGYVLQSVRNGVNGQVLVAECKAADHELVPADAVVFRNGEACGTKG